jgi:uncharacterized membrane protein
VLQRENVRFLRWCYYIFFKTSRDRKIVVYCQYVLGCYCDIQMFHASVEFTLCALLFLGALVEGNLR